MHSEVEGTKSRKKSECIPQYTACAQVSSYSGIRCESFGYQNYKRQSSENTNPKSSSVLSNTKWL